MHNSVQIILKVEDRFMADRTYNFNAMRVVLAEAHNNNNTKAITKDMITSNGLNENYFTQWCDESDALLGACEKYIRLHHDYSVSHTKELKGKVSKAYDAIFPLWKDMLSQGEKAKDVKELVCDEYDVHSLIGYAECFYASIRGTQLGISTPTQFRKKVEALIGIKMAGNIVLSNEDRDVIAAYQGALKAVASAKTVISDADKQLANFKAIIDKCADEDTKKILETSFASSIEELNKMKKNATKKITENQAILDSTYSKHQLAQAKIKGLSEIEIPINEEVEERLKAAKEAAIADTVATETDAE